MDLVSVFTPMFGVAISLFTQVRFVLQIAFITENSVLYAISESMLYVLKNFCSIEGRRGESPAILPILVDVKC